MLGMSDATEQLVGRRAWTGLASCKHGAVRADLGREGRKGVPEVILADREAAGGRPGGGRARLPGRGAGRAIV